MNRNRQITNNSEAHQVNIQKNIQLFPLKSPKLKVINIDSPVVNLINAIQEFGKLLIIKLW